MKEYICLKDFYIGPHLVTKVNDIIKVLPDDTIVVINNRGEQRVFSGDKSVFDRFPAFFGETSTEKVINNIENEVQNDVNHPKHYNNGNIECIDAMIAAYGKEAVMAFCKCNAFKYQWRFDKKNGIEDLKKAQWYQNKYIELENG